MDTAQAKELQQRIQSALDGLKIPGQKYVFSLTKLSSPSDVAATFTLKIDDMKLLSELAEVFNEQAKAHGLDPTDLNQIFWLRSKCYRVIGADWTNLKFPIIVIDERNQKKYGLTLDAVIQAKKEKLENLARFEQARKQTA